MSGPVRTRNPWFPFLHPQQSCEMRLFCFPYAGGGAGVYRAWSNRLAPRVEVVAVELPGRLSRDGEAPFHALPPLVAAVVPALLPLLDRPFAFFGHSMGALIAFEVARALRREPGRVPTCLVASAANAPQRTRFAGAPSCTLSDDELLSRVERRFGPLPSLALSEPELRRRVLRTLRADLSLLENYRFTPDEPLPCPVRALAGVEDEVVPQTSIEAWAAETGHSFALAALPGGHFFIREHVDATLRAVAGWLGCGVAVA